MKKVGIIGGVGPETTSEFYLDLIFLSAEKNKVKRPHILISSVPLLYEIEEDFILRNEKMERYIPFLIAEAKRLEACGVDFIVMPCNSLHVFINQIRESVNIPVLSIVEETTKFLIAHHMNNVGIISTSATIENKLYENAFKEHNIKYVIPNNLQQAKMGKIILNLVNGQRKNSDRDELINIINDFKDKNLNCVILACTDLQILIPNHPELKIFDTMKIFVNATVNELIKD